MILLLFTICLPIFLLYGCFLANLVLFFLVVCQFFCWFFQLIAVFCWLGAVLLGFSTGMPGSFLYFFNHFFSCLYSIRTKLLRLFTFSAAPLSTRHECGCGICVRFGQLILGTLTKIDREILDSFNNFYNQYKS